MGRLKKKSSNKLRTLLGVVGWGQGQENLKICSKSNPSNEYILNRNQRHIKREELRERNKRKKS